MPLFFSGASKAPHGSTVLACDVGAPGNCLSCDGCAVYEPRHKKLGKNGKNENRYGDLPIGLGAKIETVALLTLLWLRMR
jgi:hypothetical protein